MPAYGLSRASMAAALPPSEFPPPPIASIHQLSPSFHLGAGSSPSVDAHQDIETPYQFDTDKKTPYQFSPSPWSDSSSSKPSHPLVSDFAGARCNHPSAGHAQQNLPESYAYQGLGAFHGQGQGSYYGKPSYPAVSGSAGASCNPRHNNPFNNPISGHAQHRLPESYAYQGYGASYGQGQWSYYAGPYLPSQAWPGYIVPGYIVPGYIVPWLEPKPTGTSSDVQWCPLRPVSQPSDLRNVEDYQQKSEKGVSIKKLATSSEIPLENCDVKTAPSDKQDDVGLKSQDVVAGCSNFASDHQGLINKLATSSKVPLVNCDAKTAPLDKQDDVRLESQDVPARCSGFGINYQTDRTSDGPLTNIVNPNVDTLASGAKADDKLGSGKSFNYSNHSTSTKLTGSPSSENSKLLQDERTHLHMRSNDIKREMDRMECALSHTSTKCSMENVSPITKDADQSANAHQLLLSSIHDFRVLIARLTTEGETTLCRWLDTICMLSECLIEQSTEGSTKKLQMQNTADKVVDTSDLDKVTETVKHCLNGGRVDNNSLPSFEAGLSSLKLRKLLEGVAINENHYLKSTIENNVMAKSLEPRLDSFSTKNINAMGLQDSKSETVVEKAGESLDLKELLQIQQEQAEERAMLVKTLEKLTLEVSQMQVNVKRLMLLIQESHGQVETLGESLYDKSCKLGEAVSENKPSSGVHEWDRCSESIDAFNGSSLQYLLGETEVENTTSSLSSLFEEDTDWEHVPVCERKIG